MFYIARVFLRRSLVKFFGHFGKFSDFRKFVCKFLFRRRLQYQNCISNAVFGKNLSAKQVLASGNFPRRKIAFLQHFSYGKCCKITLFVHFSRHGEDNAQKMHILVCLHMRSWLSGARIFPTPFSAGIELFCTLLCTLLGALD